MDDKDLPRDVQARLARARDDALECVSLADEVVRLHERIEEATRIFRVLRTTGPIIPIQELGAINEWLKKGKTE